MAHIIEKTLDRDGSLSLTDLPFHAGDHVEVIIRVRDKRDQVKPERYPLRGKQPYQFDDPFSPAVPEEEWDALQ